MGECLVGVGHLLDVFTALAGSTDAVAGIEDLVGETLGHGALTAIAGEPDHPADGKGGGTTRTNLDRHLVRGATDAAALHLELRTDVVHRALEGADRLGASLLFDRGKCVVDDLLGQVALAALEDLVDELGDEPVGTLKRAVDNVRPQLAMPIAGASGVTIRGHGYRRRQELAAPDQR